MYYIDQNLQQILIFALTIFLSIFIYFLSKRFLLNAIKKVIDNNPTSSLSKVFFEEKVFHYLNYLVPIPILFAGGSYLFWNYQEHFEKVVLVYFATIFTFLLEKILSVLHSVYNQYDISKKRPIKTFIQVGKFLTYSIGILFVLSIIFNKSILAFLSGLGALTAVLIIVFKDSLLSFKAGIQLIYNDMLRIDDWVEIPKFNADGSVMEISLDTIKVRNWDNTIIFIPTYKLMEDSFKNWRGMIESGSRRISRSILLDQKSVRFLNDLDIDKFKKFHLLTDYMVEKEKELQEYNKENNIDVSEIVNGRKMTNLGTFRIYIVNIMKNHPNINKDLSLIVRQKEPNVNGLPLEIYAFVNSIDLETYEITQADIFDHILAVIPEFDLRISQI